MNKKEIFNQVAQVAIPSLTILSQAVIAFKLPQWGLIIALSSQPFWIYSSWMSYKKAGQIGILATTLITTFIIAFGVINYWLLN